MDPQHDHSQASHMAKCDACDYIAKTHAHDDDSAAMVLSEDLAAHNKTVHNEETDPQAINEAVKAKLQHTS